MPDPLDPINPAPPPDSGKAPKEGEQTGAQSMNWPGAGTGLAMGTNLVPGIGGGLLYGFGTAPLFGGGTADNPCGFPGYGSLYHGTYSTYRWMLKHPTIRLARAIATAPILASKWVYERGTTDELNDESDDADEPGESKDKPDDIDRALADVKHNFDRLRHRTVEACLRGPDFGWAGFEVVWKKNKASGRWTIDRLKPLLQDYCTLLVDKYGNLSGINTAIAVGGDGQPLRVADRKAWIYTHDGGDIGGIYGRSRLENIRETVWKDWLDCAQQIQALGGKISGIQGYGIAPAGGYNTVVNGTTVFREFRQDMADALTALAQGKQPVLTSPALQSSDPQIMAKLAGTSLIQFEVIDFGNNGPQIESLLNRMRHDEELMFQGYLVPSRVGQEGEHGTNAESETMTDTAMTGTQLLGDDIADQIQTLVDSLVYVNFGLPAGSVRIKQAPLVDHRKEALKQVITTLLGDPGFKKGFTKSVDIDKLLESQEYPLRAPFDTEDMEKPEPPPVAPSTPVPAGKKPPAMPGGAAKAIPQVAGKDEK